MSFTRSLGEVVSRAGIPYGYTLTVWSVGALCIGLFGLPSAGDVFLFLAGGTIAYAGLTLSVVRRGVVPRTGSPTALWENILAIPAVALAYATDRIVDSASVNYFLSPLVATLAYLLGLGLLVTMVTSREDLGTGPPEGSV